MKNICFQMNRKALLALVMVLTFAFPALAQKITVTGTVYEPDGEPAIGASVMVQGLTNVGAATDIDGNFRLEVAPDAVLVVSYVGYETQNVPVDGRSHIDVNLVVNNTTLSELVVVGYGAVKKADATGSVAVIKPDDIEAGLATTANDLLVGASPGVVVTTNGGNPAAGAKIRIRGGASLNASNDPLVVIDGVPMNGDYGGNNALSMIAPENIESLTILKDASATAIYGSRASNGVIIITTKKGQSGRPQVTFSANMHVNTAARRWKVLDGNEFRAMVSDKLDSYVGLLGDANTDWQDQIYRTSVSQEYNLGVGGTVGCLPYRVNASYTSNQGIIKTSGIERTTVGFNLTPKFFDGKLQIMANVKGTYFVNNNPGAAGAVGSALRYNPTWAPKTTYVNNGTGGVPFNGYTSNIESTGFIQAVGASTNPLAVLEQVSNQEKSWSSTGNLQIDYALHFLPELHLNLNLGYDVVKGESNNYTLQNSPQAWNSNYRDGAGTHFYNYQLSRNTLLDFYANYKKEFDAIRSNLDVMVGYSWQRFDFHNRNMNRINTLGYTKGADFYDPVTKTWNYSIDQATEDHIGKDYGADPDKVNYGAGQLNLISFFGRLNYSFDDTYLLTFTLRDDGTSRFSKQNRWALFPSVALGWKINNMDFFEDYTSTWNEFKLRLGWGVTGQQDLQMGMNVYTPTFTISQPSVYYPSYFGGAWIAPLYPNPDTSSLKWEETTTWNVGVDMAWLNNRLSASVDWYLRDTNNLLAYVPVPNGAFTTNMANRNIGSLRNLGVELNITARPVVTRDFTWTLGYNVGWNKNKITDLISGDDPIEAIHNPASENAGAIAVHQVGYAASTFWLYEQVYDQQGNPIPNVYVDQNGDGEISPADKVFRHSIDPTVTMNFNSTFSYKGWDLGFVLRASIGNYVYNAMRAGNSNIANIPGQGTVLNNILRQDFYFNDATINTDLVQSNYFLENAGFLRCDNITLGYTFNELLNDNLKLRLFGAVQNPFVISKYSGLDPEQPSGVDNSAYPRPMTFTLGLVATF